MDSLPTALQGPVSYGVSLFLYWKLINKILANSAFCSISSGSTAFDKIKQVAQWATIAHLGASIKFGDALIYDAQRQVTLNLKQYQT